MEEKDQCVLIGVDFNARIGLEGSNDEESWNIRKNSKDKMVNSWGREFLELVGVVGGRILNGTMEGDRKDNYTYVGPREGSVIDYVVINETCQGLVNNFSIDDRVDSDHMPLIVELKSGGKEL